MMTRLRTATVLLAATVAVLVSSASPADAAITQFSVDPVADLNTAGTLVDVSGTMACGPFTLPAQHQVLTIRLQQGGVTRGSGSNLVVCDGTSQAWAVTTSSAGLAAGTATWLATTAGSDGIFPAPNPRTGTLTLV
jgi:hypothetical protein